MPSSASHRVVKSGTSHVTLIPERGVVEKRVDRHLQHDVVDREVHWLRHLADWDRVPDLISVDGNCLTLSYMGEGVTAATLPRDWRAQAADILAAMKRYGVRHNDIKPRDILVLEGRLRLIDWGWATASDEIMPGTWPKVLGGRWRPPHGYDDAYTLDKVLNYVAARRR